MPDEWVDDDSVAASERRTDEAWLENQSYFEGCETAYDDDVVRSGVETPVTKMLQDEVFEGVSADSLHDPDELFAFLARLGIATIEDFKSYLWSERAAVLRRLVRESIGDGRIPDLVSMGEWNAVIAYELGEKPFGGMTYEQIGELGGICRAAVSAQQKKFIARKMEEK